MGPDMVTEYMHRKYAPEFASENGATVCPPFLCGCIYKTVVLPAQLSSQQDENSL
jgi:hypothetical protein